MRRFLGLALTCAAAIFMMSAAITTNTAGLEVGDTAPDFELKNIDGTMVSLESTAEAYQKEDIEVKGFIVIFTCNTCPYAVMYEDRIQELHAEMAPKGWPVVAIQPNDTDVKPADDLDHMKQRAEEKGFTFSYVIDEGQKIYPEYGATRTPHVFLLDRERTVKYIGAIDDNPRDASAVTERFVVKAIESVEKGGNPDPDFTKAIGCSIKVKS